MRTLFGLCRKGSIRARGPKPARIIVWRPAARLLQPAYVRPRRPTVGPGPHIALHGMYCTGRYRSPAEISSASSIAGGPVTGLAKVPVATTVPILNICTGHGKLPGNGANRDYSSQFTHLRRAWLTGLANEPIATAVPASEPAMAAIPRWKKEALPYRNEK